MAKKKKVGAKTMPMRVLDEKSIPYDAHQGSSKQYTAEGVAEDLSVPVAQVVKAMLVQLSTITKKGGSSFALFVVPCNRRLSLKKVAEELEDKNVKLASERDVQRITGFQVGAVSVLGFRRDDVPGYVDQRVLDLEQVIISAGRPDVGLALVPSDMVRAIEGCHTGDYCED
jgi:Cys-tRNA(Pro)/Cys-tRNA(Cys) deacylase